MNGVSKNQNGMSQSKASKLAKMGMLVAISIVLVYFIHIPTFTTFYEYDPADIPILLGTFAFGPWAGLLLTVVTSLIQGVTVSAAGGVYGILMHIIATGTFVLVAGLIYKKEKSRRRAIIGLVCGAVAMAVIMIPANVLITPYFLGAPRSAVVAMIPIIIGFNLMKAGINSILTFLLYKRISRFLHR
ncbi:ECF transporter S component [bacterium 210820-DFI.6.37]|nr:ECF transporter S component [bacterium 210820-DFI.6.37]